MKIDLSSPFKYKEGDKKGENISVFIDFPTIPRRGDKLYLDEFLNKKDFSDDFWSENILDKDFEIEDIYWRKDENSDIYIEIWVL